MHEAPADALEGLRLVHVGGVHVADAVIDQRPGAALGTGLQGHALVVHADLLARRQVVVHDHLPRSADQGGANLHRGEPVHVQVGDQVIVELDRDVGQVLVPAEVGAPHRRDPDRVPVEQVVHDRDVVGGEVPDHVQIVLEQAQADPDGVEVQHVPDRPALDDLLDLVHGGVVDEGVIHHQREAPGVRELHERLRRLGGMRHRLLDQNVLAGLEGRLREGVVGPHRRADRQRVDLRVPEEVLEAGVGPGGGVAPLQGRDTPGVKIADRPELGAFGGAEVAEEVGAPVTQPDDGHADRLRAGGRRHRRDGSAGSGALVRGCHAGVLQVPGTGGPTHRPGRAALGSFTGG